MYGLRAWLLQLSHCFIKILTTKLICDFMRLFLVACRSTMATKGQND